jgi:hypothetical protein
VTLVFFIVLVPLASQINTVPMKSRVGFVEVVVPPQILVNETSSDVVASEGSNVSLHCKATGHPPPQIQWKREDRKDIPLQTPQGKKYVGKDFVGSVSVRLKSKKSQMKRLVHFCLLFLPLDLPSFLFMSIYFWRALMNKWIFHFCDSLFSLIQCSPEHQWRITDDPSSDSSSHGSSSMHRLQRNSAFRFEEGIPQSPM